MTPSNIGWTDYVWNAGGGCARVSPGCEFCWAETLSPRLAKMGQARHVGLTVVGQDGRARWSRESVDWPDRLADPLKVKAPKRVFVFSMSDLFYERRSFEYIAAVFGVMAAAPQHTFQILTKRPERAVAFFEWVASGCSKSDGFEARYVVGCYAATELGHEFGPEVNPGAWPLPNVHLGVSVEDQQRADERIPKLLSCPAAVRWVSYEPALGPLSLLSIPANHAGATRDMIDVLSGREWYDQEDPSALVDEEWDDPRPIGPRLDWVVAGGESGAGHRPVDPDWIESVVAQCTSAGVPVFVKQDSGSRPGTRGRLSAETWAHKEFPR